MQNHIRIFNKISVCEVVYVHISGMWHVIGVAIINSFSNMNSPVILNDYVGLWPVDGCIRNVANLKIRLNLNCSKVGTK